MNFDFSSLQKEINDLGAGDPKDKLIASLRAENKRLNNRVCELEEDLGEEHSKVENLQKMVEHIPSRTEGGRMSGVEINNEAMAKMKQYEYVFLCSRNEELISENARLKQAVSEAAPIMYVHGFWKGKVTPISELPKEAR